MKDIQIFSQLVDVQIRTKAKGQSVWWPDADTDGHLEIFTGVCVGTYG